MRASEPQLGRYWSERSKFCGSVPTHDNCGQLGWGARNSKCAPATASRKAWWITRRGRRDVQSGCQTQNDRMLNPPVFDILTG